MAQLVNRNSLTPSPLRTPASRGPVVSELRESGAETWGTVPPKFEVGDGPCIGPPNILRSSVVGCVWKYEQSEKWCFSCEKMVIYDI